MSRHSATDSTITVIDDFSSVANWKPVMSGEASLEIRRDRRAMRLDFDFHGSGGFVVARREVDLRFPELYALKFKLRGAAPVNHFELKLVDETGHNVWWHQRKHLKFPHAWSDETIPSREIGFAWGPAGGGSVGQVSAIEIAITADEGGRGSIWIADLKLEDRTLKRAPSVTASSSVAGSGPGSLLLPGASCEWRSNRRRGQWLMIDFHRKHEYGGLIIDWIEGLQARDYDVEISDNRRKWKQAATVHDSSTTRSFVPLPGAESRYLRLKLREGLRNQSFGIRHIDVQPFDFSRSINSFFTHIAGATKRGLYPRYLVGEQSYWTPVSTSQGAPQALMNEEGLIEMQPGSASLEPFLLIDDKLITWADATVTVSLDNDCLPLPIVRWSFEGVVLEIRACAVATKSGPEFHVSYTVLNQRSDPLRAKLVVAVRPFQVTPPWQAFKTFGGAATLRQLDFTKSKGKVNGALDLTLHPHADGCGVAAFHHGDITTFLEAGKLPEHDSVHDETGHASGAWRWNLELDSGAQQHIELTFPGSNNRRNAFKQARGEWAALLSRVEFHVPASAKTFTDTFRTAAAHVLLNRQGFAFQPGARRYTRSWIRDGVMMGAALLRAGFTTEMRDYLRWYVTYQADSGAVPCCVDESGPDWLAEHDSHGQLVVGVAEYMRFTHDLPFLREMWPALKKALRHLDDLRAQCMTPEFDDGDKLADRGLLPESASHEGYLAHPVHAYWDDFWALRAYRDAADMAVLLDEDTTPFHAAAVSMEASIRASMQLVMKHRHIESVPGSVEWADFDPTATSNAVALLDEMKVFPVEALEATYRQYLDGWRRQRSGEMDWANYTAYEVRIIGALVRLGWRDEANELARFLVSDQRPAAWHQWPEISWRNPRSPGHLGDVPHSWISAEFMLSFRDMLAHEHLADNSLVLCAGIQLDWLNDGGVRVRGLPTYFGLLSFAVRYESDTIRFSLEPSWKTTPAVIVLRPPLPGSILSVDDPIGAVLQFTDFELKLRPCGCELVIRCSTSPLP